MKVLTAAESVQFLAKDIGLLSALRIADKMFGYAGSESIGFLNKYTFKDKSYVIYNPQTLVIESINPLNQK